MVIPYHLSLSLRSNFRVDFLHIVFSCLQELQCNPEDCALHQQWLMFTFAVIDWKVKSKLAADKGSVFTISRRISALVVKHVQDVQTCLRLAFLSEVVSSFCFSISCF